MSTNLQNPVSMKLHAASIQGRVAIPKLLVSAHNAMKMQLCRDHLNWAQRQWEQFICYAMAFGDGPRHFEPWSSDVDDT
ncbi:hypothetical protein TNCV_5098501 [Trichonephila clavipes]|uniref:Uncharacterized protein n=1 Tax=Trichonephila clavipes TaxID=2585209 RepID=A0A8X6VC22_TRICX|nr:hypothetical protein TNCV_5098501 [Trichonephila clavipes]